MSRFLVAAALIVGAQHLLASPALVGTVVFGGLPVPGAIVTATSGAGQPLVTATDEEGVFRLPDVRPGVWIIRVEMLGFQSLTREVTVPAESPPASWDLTLRPFQETVSDAPASANATASSSPVRTGASPAASSLSGFRRASISTSPAPPAAVTRSAAPLRTDEPTADGGPGAADGFLINGSVNNGAASPFAQPPAFGNNRRQSRSQFNFGFALVNDNSAFDARPFTFAGQPTSKPAYNDLHVAGTFGGPLRFSHGLRNGPVVFAAFQHADDHMATTQAGVMPTVLERLGNFSQSVDAFGRPVQILDPTIGKPFAGGIIPGARISPQAASLLALYPSPNAAGAGVNFQTSLLTGTVQDLLTTRATQTIGADNQLIGLFAYQRTLTNQTTLFGFQDASGMSGVDTSLAWTHRLNRAFSVRSRVQFTQVTTTTTPSFANRVNVSGLAGIAGNDQDPVNWGPPGLAFSTVTSLTDALPNLNRTQTYGGGAELYWSHGRHNVIVGGDLKRNAVDILSQQNPRGAFTFTGAVTGSDVADFLLGFPSTSSIAFGNADKYLRALVSDAYVTDDWRVSPTLTLQIGARWDHEGPPTERLGRLVNLDVTSGFSAVSPVLAGGVGPQTGRSYSSALLQPDRFGLQPRVAMAWRPRPDSSLVIRAGYGIYRSTSVYRPITTLLAQQPPLSTAFTVANSPDHPLTLANGFTAPVGAMSNTFAVDPDLRVGNVHNWQALVQRDVPGSLTITGTYLGTRGFNLLREFLPNTYPVGAANPCPTCPSGFVYLTSNGTSLRNAGQVQVRRRLRNGLAASVQYTLAKATDDATAFAGVSLSGSAIAQDWRNLSGEQALSNFDQRHQVTGQVQYTTGMGIGGGAFMDGMKGRLFKGWTVTGQLTAGSGLPLTPVYLAPVPGSGVTGSLRPSVAGTLVASSGYYLNPSAYVAPPLGAWGDAGRNSIRGPAQFSLAAGVTRTFQWTERLSLDWRLDATNVLNVETFTGVNTIVGGPQFGLPNLASTPRKILSTIRMRF